MDPTRDYYEPPGHSDLKPEQLNSLRRLARLMDSSIPLPGGFKVGLDGIVGLIPGIGDLLGTLASSYIVATAARAGISSSTIAMMVYNVALEAIVGSIPVVGDIFDFAWKANEKNIALIDAYELNPKATKRNNKLRLIFPLAVLLLIIGVTVMIAISLFKFIVGVLS